MRLHRLLPLVLLACSGGELKAHGVAWTPPRGVERIGGDANETRLSNGVTLRVQPTLGAADDANLNVVREALVPPDETLVVSATGTVPAGAVVRLVSTKGTERTLRYYVPRGEKAVVISLTAPSASYTPKEQKLDLSMSSLRFEPK